MQVPLQTPLHGSESEALLVASVLVWLIICYVLANFSNKLGVGEFLSFIVFVMGVLVLLFLLY